MSRIFKLIVVGGIPFQKVFKVQFFQTALADKDKYELILKEIDNISSVNPQKKGSGLR